MFQPFESRAHQWINRHEKAVEEYCQKCFADTTTSQSNLERFIRSAAHAKPPIILSCFAQESYIRACSENLLEDNQYDASSIDLEPNLVQSVPASLGKNKLLPLPSAYINSDSSFERQDPQNVHTKFETITQSFIGIGGHLYQLREVIDYWLPKDTSSTFEFARMSWWPSQLVEQARLRTIDEINRINMRFTGHLQVVNNAIGDLREGAFGGRLNTKSVTASQQMFDKLRDLRRLVLLMQRPASDRARSLGNTSAWLSGKCLRGVTEIKEPYQPERFNQNDPLQAHLGDLFGQHCAGIIATVKFLSEAYDHLANIFKTVDCICKTIVEGLHKLMLDVHLGQTTGEFVASWANRWERVTLSLLLRVVGLPAINAGLQRNFPTTEVEFVDFP